MPLPQRPLTDHEQECLVWLGRLLAHDLLDEFDLKVLEELEKLRKRRQPLADTSAREGRRRTQ